MQEQDMKKLQETLSDFSQRLSSVEEDVSELKQNKAEKKRVDIIRNQIENLSEQLETLSKTVEKLDNEIERLDDLDEDVSEISNSLSSQKEVLRKQIQDTNERVAGLRKEVKYDVDEEKDDLTIPEETSRVEYISVLPKNLREDVINSQPLLRAAVIYDNFERWSEYTPKGYVLKSGDIKRSYPENLEYQQIYRAMEEFGRNTKSDFSYINTDSTGRALIKHKK